MPCRQRTLVGRGGLEPPTSRLSGVRSNHLSYRPKRSGTAKSRRPAAHSTNVREGQCGCRANRPRDFGFAKVALVERVAPQVRQQGLDTLHQKNGEANFFGGAYRDRTDDPLLAKQVLSQLS